MSINTILHSLKQSTFLRQNMLFFSGSLVVSVLNYAYYPVLGRMLNLGQYGDVQVLISIFLQLTLLLTVLTQVTVSVMANYKDKNKKHRIIFELEKLTFWVGALVVIIGLAFSGLISSSLKFESAWPLVILYAAFLSTIPFNFRSAYLRGRQQFGTVSIANILASFIKLLASALLVTMGFGVGGALGGLIIAQLLALTYVFMKARQQGLEKTNLKSYVSLPDWGLLFPELRYAAFVLVASLSITVLSTIDVIAVKYYFDAETAGGYAGIATVGKIVFFLTTSVVQVMMPSIKMNRPVKENRQFLLKSFVFLSVLSGMATIIFMLLPQFVVKLFMGHDYVPYAHLLPLLSLALFLLSIANLLVNYYIALRKYKITFAVLASVGITLVLLLTNHETTASIVNSMVMGTSSLLLLLVIWRALLARKIRSPHV